MNDPKSTIKEILFCFEQGKPTPNYQSVYIYNDGPSDCKQVTYSFGITEYGNLSSLIQKYITAGGIYSKQFLPYVNEIGKKPLASDTQFQNYLKLAGVDPIMHQCLDNAFDSMYYIPAETFFNKNGFTLPLSMAVIADSYLQSGSILCSLRNAFNEKIPASGGNEKNWISEYLTVRQNWLATSSRTILHATVYRTEFFLNQIKIGNWNLDQFPIFPNGVKLIA